MAESSEIPISKVLGVKGGQVKIERSWAEDVPGAVGANAPPVPEFNRESEILAAIKRRRNPHEVKEWPQLEELKQPAVNGIQALPKFHFFVLKGRKLEWIGSTGMDKSKFANDVSGRFFRGWIEKTFPGRRDYMDIVSFDDNARLKDIVELLEMTE